MSLDEFAFEFLKATAIYSWGRSRLTLAQRLAFREFFGAVWGLP